MKALPAFGAMAIGIVVGYGVILLDLWWPIAVALGFVTFASATFLIERRIRNGAERRALRDYENAKRVGVTRK